MRHITKYNKSVFTHIKGMPCSVWITPYFMAENICLPRHMNLQPTHRDPTNPKDSVRATIWMQTIMQPKMKTASLNARAGLDHPLLNTSGAGGKAMLVIAKCGVMAMLEKLEKECLTYCSIPERPHQ